MERSAQGSTGLETPAVPDGDGRARVPAQTRPGSSPYGAGYGEDADRERCGPTDAARGEHTHGEAPSPSPSPSPLSSSASSGSPVSSASPAPGLARVGAAPAPSRPVIQRASVRGQILDALRTALVTGELLPGEVYSAPVLGERFGVSATPVREAMQQLALEGAVEVAPNRGFRVVVRGARELAELAEVRALIEVPVMLRLARTVPGERWTELRPLAEAGVRAAATGCRATYAEADRRFHRALLALSGNEQLVAVADDLHRRSQWPPVGAPARRGRADLVADAAEHLSLLEALTAGELDVVQKLTRDHCAGSAG
ncbi:GntR family transcriptional regulator [Streptomyces sp. NBC_00704]|uniref:GntR family transcriptional regulator n=1 Tax=Streptomyces sp. NBC_00704 TaxID=2975809 RepID=UPI002E32D6B9|nr:GntR family transcriptional regulator [Streptomyces sp. NBC_00704]